MFLECDQKRDQAKSKALEIYFRKFCFKPNTRNFNVDYYSSHYVGFPEMAIFFVKTKRNVNIGDSLPCPTEFFTPTTRVCTDGRCTLGFHFL